MLCMKCVFVISYTIIDEGTKLWILSDYPLLTHHYIVVFTVVVTCYITILNKKFHCLYCTIDVTFKHNGVINYNTIFGSFNCDSWCIIRIINAETAVCG